MTAAALLLSALLAADSGTTSHPAPVQTIDMATLTPLTARPGLGRFVFLPGSRSCRVSGRVGVEAAGPDDCLRCVEFDPCEEEDGLDVLAPVLIEGVLVVRHHPAWGEFADVEEVLVREARREPPG
jgi:hypothetical protein